MESPRLVKNHSHFLTVATRTHINITQSRCVSILLQASLRLAHSQIHCSPLHSKPPTAICQSRNMSDTRQTYGFNAHHNICRCKEDLVIGQITNPTNPNRGKFYAMVSPRYKGFATSLDPAHFNTSASPAALLLLPTALSSIASSPRTALGRLFRRSPTSRRT